MDKGGTLLWEENWSKEDLAEIKKIPIVDYAQNVLNRTPVRYR